MQNYTDEQLDDVLGTSSRQFIKYRVLTIDNGIDLAGTDTTGDFVEKTYNSETKETKRVPYAPEFQGVILSSQAQLVDKVKFPTWRTDEFDPTNTEFQIPIYPLKDGKFIRDIQTNKIKKSYATYSEIKSARKIKQPDGSSQSTYNYFVVLYVGIEKEVIKLRFKGTGRGNYFNYNKSVSSLGAKIYNIMTNFSTYIDKSTGKYTVKFDIVKDEKDNPVSVNPEQVREMRIKIAQGFQAFNKNQISAPQIKKIESTNNSPIREDEIVKEDVNIADVPFE